MVVVVIRYKTKATARWALTFIVRIFVNDTIAIAVRTSFHVCVYLEDEQSKMKLHKPIKTTPAQPYTSPPQKMRQCLRFAHLHTYALSRL